MKYFLTGLICFVLGAIFGMWLLSSVVCWVMNKLDKEGGGWFVG